MKWEDLITVSSETATEQAAILENRLINLRNANRQEMVNRIDREEHRREQVTQYRGVYFINDSMACTTNATYYTFETLQNRTIWLAGGDDSQTNYMELVGFVSQKVKRLICIGNDNKKLIKAFSAHISDIQECRDMEQAVKIAFYAAENSDLVLLSPASECDSIYENYETRGKAFKKAIAQL